MSGLAAPHVPGGTVLGAAIGGPVASTVSLSDANLLDAQASAGNKLVRLRISAILRRTNAMGMSAKSATSAVLLMMARRRNLGLKEEWRALIAELRDLIAEDQWPQQIIWVNQAGEEVLVTLGNADEAKDFLEELDSMLASLR